MRGREGETGTMTPARRRSERLLRALCAVCGEWAGSLARGRLRREAPKEWSARLRAIAAALEDETIEPPKAVIPKSLDEFAAATPEAET